MSDLRLATRRSPLAMAQAEAVVARLRVAHGDDIRVSLIAIDSTGDLDRSTPVAALTQMGAFVSAVQIAVLEGRADAAVHSLKDLPTVSPVGLIPVAFPERADPRDALVGSTLNALEPGALVGTGSPRRVAQLRSIRPDLETGELRGNVGTRIDKVRAGEVAAAILAAAGLNRLQRSDAIAELFEVDVMVPAPGQGVLVVEAPPQGAAAEMLQDIDDGDLRALAETERRLLAETGAGCRSALGAFAVREGDKIRFHTFVEDEAGARRAVVTGGDQAEVVAAARKELGL